MGRTRVWDRWHDDASCPGQGSNHGAALISFLFLTLISFLFLTKVFFFFHTVLWQRLYYGKKATAKAILRQRLYKASLPCVVTWASTSIIMYAATIL